MRHSFPRVPQVGYPEVVLPVGQVDHTPAPTDAAAPAQAPAPGGLALIQSMAGAEPGVVAEAATKHPAEWPHIAEWLHKARGNAFVQRVLAKMNGTENELDLASLTPEQREQYATIKQRDPKITEKDAIHEAKIARPLSSDDKAAVLAAAAKLAAVKPRPINPGNNPNVVQIEVAFDGTWNNRDEMAFDSNAALVHDLFEGTKHYEKGLATDPSTNIVGGYFGAGISNRINDAYAEVVAQVNAAKQANPHCEVVLIVTGFSRGSAAARAFANTLNKRGVPDTSSARTPGGGYSKMQPAPRIGAMILFDTVGSIGIPGTNLNPGLDLTIPANAENVLHLTAGDEKRGGFPLSAAKDARHPDDPRITEIALPGAHSDVGGSYANDYSKIPLAMATDYAHRAGVNVKPSAMPDVNNPAMRLHDSGGSGTRTVYDSHNPTDDVDVQKRPGS